MKNADQRGWGVLTMIAVVSIILGKAFLVAASVSLVFAAVCAFPITLMLGLLAAGEIIEHIRSHKARRQADPALATA